MRTEFRGRLLLSASALALAALFPPLPLLRADEKPAPPADPGIRAEVETLCRQLSDSDFQTRETASERLLELGDDAVWALRQVADGSDLEASARAKEILEEVAWVPPSQRKRIEDLCATLRDSADEGEQARAYQSILQNGKAGQRALARLFAHPEARPEGFELRVETDRGQVERGQTITIRARLTNKGKQGIWISRTGLTASAGTRREVGAYRAPDARMMMIMGLVQDIGVRQSAFSFRFLKPGETQETTLTLDPMQTDHIGWIEPTASYQGDGGMQAGIGGARLVVRLGAGGVQTQTQQAIASAAPLSLEGKGRRVYILPTAASSEAPALLEAKTGDACEAGKTVSVEVAIRARGDEAIRVAAPRDGAPAEGFWAAWIDAEGRIASFSAFPGAKDPPVAEETVTVSKEQPLVLKGEIPAPATPGTYQLRVGYSAVEGPSGMRTVGARGGMPVRRGRVLMPQDRKPSPAEKDVALWIGHLVADQATVTVK